jgi:hypothetical protein
VEKVVLAALFGAHTIGDIAVDDDQFVDLALAVADGARGGLEDAPGAIVMADAVREVFAAFPLSSPCDELVMARRSSAYSWYRVSKTPSTIMALGQR